MNQGAVAFSGKSATDAKPVMPESNDIPVAQMAHCNRTVNDLSTIHKRVHGRALDYGPRFVNDCLLHLTLRTCPAQPARRFNVKTKVNYTWEHLQDNLSDHAPHAAWSTPEDAPSQCRQSRRAVCLLLAAVTLAMVAATAQLWRDAKAQQRMAQHEAVTAMAQILAAADDGEAQALRPPAISQVSYRGDRAFARVDTPQGIRRDLVLQKTATGWQRVAPTGRDWGAQQVVTVDALSIAYWEKDAATVHAALPEVESRYTFIRQMLTLADSPAPLRFVLAPDALGMTMQDAHQRVVIIPGTNITEGERITYLIDALLRPLVVQTVLEIAGPGAANPAWGPLITAAQDWLVTNSYPRMSTDFMDVVMEVDMDVEDVTQSVFDQRATESRPEFMLLRASVGTEDDSEVLIRNVVSLHGYAGLGALLRATGGHENWSTVLASGQCG